jgi:hypothetical protein
MVQVAIRFKTRATAPDFNLLALTEPALTQIKFTSRQHSVLTTLRSLMLAAALLALPSL